MTIAETGLLLVVTAGAGWDLATGKIPNALTYPACLFAWSLAAATGGWHGLGASLAGFAVGFLPFFVLYLMGGLGGGDVKLMAAVGSLTGVAFTLDALIASVLIGALIGLLIAIWEGQGVAVARFLGTTLGRLFIPSLQRTEVAVRQGVPFGVAICLGAFLTLIARWQGLASPAALIPGF